MPKVLGRYHIISELGRGGMGVVYKAVDPKLERFIAIKCLSDELSSDEITVTRFLREARNVAALNHPHIAQIFLADEDEGKPYFVMEYVDGESLAERLGRDKRLMPEQALRIVTECAEALKAAHEENIIHRDIKPGNIMLDRRGRTVLTDFGIASIVHPDNEPRSSRYIMGTPGYLPPEVMTGQPADHRGDIFALGAVFYEMLAGKRLVPGRDIEDTARTLLAKDFPELGELDDQVDDFTFGVLGRMLAPDPDKRFQNYPDLLAGLRSERAAVASMPETEPGLDPTRLAGATPSAAGGGRAKPDTAPAPAPAAEAAPVTAAVDSGAAQPPPTAVAPPPAGRSRVAKYSMVTALVLGLCVLGLGLARLIPERWDQVTALFDTSSDATPAVDAGPEPDVEGQPDARSAALEPDVQGQPDALSSGPERLSADIGPASDGRSVSGLEPEPADRAATGDDLAGERIAAAKAVDEVPADQDRAGEEVVASGATENVLASNALLIDAAETESAAPARAVADVSSAASSATVPSAGPSEPEPAPPTTPVVADARGVLVVGQGDPVFVDPMVRAVEDALHGDGHDLVERGFVSGLTAVTAGDEVDLAGLSRAATAAGARYAVVVRAMPAGQRQLTYYGRSDTLFVVQTETITYDLVEGRRLGASALEQIDYTALNATQKARQAIAPRLAAISDDLHRAELNR